MTSWFEGLKAHSRTLSAYVPGEIPRKRADVVKESYSCSFIPALYTALQYMNNETTIHEKLTVKTLFLAVCVNLCNHVGF